MNSGEGRAKLIRALGDPTVQPAVIAGRVAAVLMADTGIAGLLRQAEDGVLPAGPALRERVALLGTDPLLLALMVSAVVPDACFERLFTGLRRALLEQIDHESHSTESLRFCVALAIQAFHTDYAWYVTDDEAAAVDHLCAGLDRYASADGIRDVPLPRLALAAAYRPLYRLALADAAARSTSWPEPFGTLIRLQIREPADELALRSQIPRLTPITDPVSRLVRAQYEEHPYPRWVRPGRGPERTSLPRLLASLGLPVPADPSFATPDVLIAGCGTGLQSVIAALAYENAKILAVDLSLTSLAYACRKTRELGLANIEYAQADLLALGVLGRRFHVIESGGVLHHLADPLAGWRVLAGLLHPGGIMNIGLYSEAGRTTVSAARAFIAQKGYPATEEGIRQCRRDLLYLPEDHPLAGLRRMRDLFNLSECRDLLFHVQEHRFTLPRIQAALDELGLRFLAFNSPEHDAAYRKRFPDDPDMRSLEHWHRFEQEHPAAFAGMYNFLVQYEA